MVLIFFRTQTSYAFHKVPVNFSLFLRGSLVLVIHTNCTKKFGNLRKKGEKVIPCLFVKSVREISQVGLNFIPARE